MKVVLLFFLILLINLSECPGQSAVYGTIMDSASHKLLAGASVLLLNAVDSSLVKGSFADLTGNYHFNNIRNGIYLIAATYKGYGQAFSKSIEVIGQQTNVSLKLQPEQQLLTKITVIAKRPLLEQKIDRLVINVSNSITASGNTALEVLERSPGITLDRQSSLLSMDGKNGVVIMLNGRISHMPINAVVQLLSGIPANNIERIELITTPPANLDAEGNAGYINIVLKENDNYGTNGSFSLTGGYSKGHISENSFNINHRDGIVNLYGDLSFSTVSSPLHADALNRFVYKSVLTSSAQDIERRAGTQNFSARAGVDIELSKHTVLGLLFSGLYNHLGAPESTITSKDRNGTLDTLIRSMNNANFHWSNYSGNINLQHAFKEENKLIFNIDYIHYSNSQPIDYNSNYFNGAGLVLYNSVYRTKNTAPVHFWVTALDLANRISTTITIETGIKTMLSHFDNDVGFERLLGTSYIRDNSLSAIYQLKENYHAAYGAFTAAVNKMTVLKTGLRYEYSNSNLGSDTKGNIIVRHYGSWFPSIFLSHKLNDQQSMNISYSRRITRPTSPDLAPFTYFQDPNTIVTGNPTLQPAFSNTIKLSYNYIKYSLSLSLSKEDNAIVSFQPSADSVTSKTVLSPTNLNNLKLISMNLSIPITISQWWTMQYNLAGYWRQINTAYNQQQVQLNQINFQLNGNMNFLLPKDFSMELSGFYSSRALNGIVMNKANGTVDFGLKKNWPQTKSSFVLTASNIFNTLGFRSITNLPEQHIYSALNIIYAYRSYRLTFTHRFGKEKLKQKRERVTGAEDEKGRLQ